MRWRCGAAALLLLVGAASAFNVDTKNAVIHHMPKGYFGYSMDFYLEQKGMPVLVVGAPEGETTNPNLRGIRRPGAVYVCSVNKPTCREAHVDPKQGNERRLNGSVLAPIEDKSFQFFGATVRSNKKHDRLLMCAPKYKYFFSKFEVIEPVGTCFYAENGFNKIEEYSSCKQEPARHGRHRLGYGECGFSAAIPDRHDKKDERVFIGAPGVWYWQGAVFSQSLRNKTDRPNTEYSHDKYYDHDMMGYSTATGDFDGDGIDDAVAGLPRGNDLAGKLALYTTKLKHIVNLTDTISSQPGQYCGGAVIVADVNKDGRDDIIVGCPFFTDYVTVVDAKTQERKPQYDVGKVLIFYQTAPGVFGKSQAIVGEDQYGRFGYSLAVAGDVNQDGYTDFIVGAPYAGTDRQGAVYVMHGGKDGVREKYTQKIEGKAMGTNTFGFAVAGGVDVDGNGIPDIAAGGWKSGKAIVMMTKPVVTVHGNTEADAATLNVEEKNCDVDQKIGKQSCRTINTCFRYEGKGDTPNDLEFVLTYNLDDHSPSPRAYFLQKDIQSERDVKVASGSKTKDHPNVIERRVRLEKNRQKCFKQRFFASSTMRDKLSPIHWTVNYTYIESKTGKLRGDKLEPAIDTTVPTAFEGKVNIANNCGKDNVCIPDLRVTAFADREKFLLGTKDNTMLINVTVRNGGEDSYETKLYFDVPFGFEYSGVQSTDDKAAPTCSPTTDHPSEDGTWTFGCDLGNPLPANKVTSTIVRLTADEKNPPLKPIEIKAFVNSSNEEAEGTGADNAVTFNIPVDFKNQLSLNGRSNPEEVVFSIHNKSRPEIFDDREIGPVVSHLFQVSNRGPSEVDSATLDIFWPSFSTQGRHLLYIITDPVVSDPRKGRCRVKQAQNINPLNLRVTNEHIPTDPPTPVADYRSAENYEDEDSAGAPGVPAPTSFTTYSNGGNGGNGESHFVYKEKTTVKPDYEYIPDEEYDGEYEEDDERAGSRVKREPRRRQKTEREDRGEGKSDKAKFSDLKSAVQTSKAAGGTADYHGPLSRASVDCNSLRCTHIECDLYGIQEGEYVLVEVFARMVTNTLVEEKSIEGEVSSLALVRVTSTKFNWPHKPTLVTAVVTGLHGIDDSPSGWSLPWWLWLLALLIGLTILALLILCLWRCGFFKRNRPEATHAELRENRDPHGHYADTKTRYAPGESYNPNNHGPML